MGFVYNILFTLPISYVCSLTFGLHLMVLHLCILYFRHTLYFYTHGIFSVYYSIYIFLCVYFMVILYRWIHTYPLHKMYYPFSFSILHIFSSAYCVCQDIVYPFIVLFFLFTMYFVIFHYNPHI